MLLLMEFTLNQLFCFPLFEFFFLLVPSLKQLFRYFVSTNPHEAPLFFSFYSHLSCLSRVLYTHCEKPVSLILFGIHNFYCNISDKEEKGRRVRKFSVLQNYGNPLMDAGPKWGTARSFSRRRSKSTYE